MRKGWQYWCHQDFSKCVFLKLLMETRIFTTFNWEKWDLLTKIRPVPLCSQYAKYSFSAGSGHKEAISWYQGRHPCSSIRQQAACELDWSQGLPEKKLKAAVHNTEGLEPWAQVFWHREGVTSKASFRDSGKAQRYQEHELKEAAVPLLPFLENNMVDSKRMLKIKRMTKEFPSMLSKHL